MSRPRDDQPTTTYSGAGEAPPLETTAEHEVESPPAGSLAAHLARSDRGEEARLSAERYAAGLAAVAGSLVKLHERGVVHGNVRPESLLFHSGTGKLELPPPVITAAGAPLPAGDPYVAPEQHLGEEGPSIDQYALGVVAREVFTSRAAPDPTVPLQDALRRGTAPNPDDRFADVGQFGDALTRAVRREAPRGLGDRLAAWSARSRAALAPGALNAAIVLAVALGDARDPLAGPLFTAVLAPIVAGAIAVVAGGLVWIAAAIRRPSWPSLRLVQPFWVPLAVVGAILAVVARSGGGVAENGFQVIVGVYAARALLAPPSESVGRWLIRLLRVWDTRRTRTPARRRAISVAAYGAVLGVLLAPVALGMLWPIPFEFPSSPAREYAPLVAVASFRGAMGNDEYGYACRRLMTRAAAAPARDCPAVVRWAAVVLDNDPAVRVSGQVLGMRGSLSRFQVQELPHAGNGRFWTILAPDGELEAGAMYTVGTSESRVIVILSRDPPQPPDDLRSLWLYEVVDRPDWWRIAEFRACDVGAPGSGKRDARCLARSGLPGARVRALLAKVGSGAK